jgi:hypothetical protein
MEGIAEILIDKRIAETRAFNEAAELLWGPDEFFELDSYVDDTPAFMWNRDSRGPVTLDFDLYAAASEVASANYPGLILEDEEIPWLT